MNTSESTDTTETDRTLRVRVDTPGNAFDRVEDRLAAIDAGETPEPLFEVVLQSEEDLQRLLSAKNIELLRVIAREEPGSIRDLCRRVDRDIRQVHDALSRLEEMGLVEFDESGRSKRPRVWYDDITIDVPIGA